MAQRRDADCISARAKLKLFSSTFMHCPQCGGGISYSMLKAYLAGFGSVIATTLLVGLFFWFIPKETPSLQYILIMFGSVLVLAHAIWCVLYPGSNLRDALVRPAGD